MGFDDDEQIVSGGDFVLYESEGFAEAAFDEVAPDGVAAAGADGNAQT